MDGLQVKWFFWTIYSINLYKTAYLRQAQKVVLSQVSPEILTQGKNRQMAANILEANFEKFRVLTARGM